MTSPEAKQALLLFRPGLDDERDPDFAPALTQMRSDPDLKKWFDQHCAMQKAVFSAFDGLSVPEGLKEQILSERPAFEAPVPRRKTLTLVLAGILLLLLLTFLIAYSRSGSQMDFSTYRMGMAGKVLRSYPKMDLLTTDLNQIRQYLAEHGGQKDYVLPAGLQKVAGTGCAIFEWRGKRVSMVCFNSGKNSSPKRPDLFLFVVDRSAIKDPLAHCGPEILGIKSLATASWSDERKTYLLAGSGNQDFLKQYY